MNRHFVFFAFALLIALFTTAPCWGTIDVDIAISTQPNWISQQAADREANEIVSKVRNSVNDIRVFTKDQESQLASWVQSHTNNGQLDVLILFGVFPDSIYPSGNKQTDGSIAEKFLEAGNMIINTADYMFYIPYNAELGIRNMMDLQDVTMWFGGDMKVTNSGNQYLPSLSPYTTTRALKLDGIKSPWTVEAVFAQNTEGTLAEPVVVRDTATGGRLAIFYQLINDDAPRGEVISEFILNWLPTVAGGTVEPDDGVTPPDTPGEFVLMGTDPDEYSGVLADIHQVFASSDASQVKFKVTTYRRWGEYAIFYVNMDVDQNPNTGDPSDGVDYLVYVSREGSALFGGLWFYDPSQREYVPKDATIDVLFNPNSDVFQVHVNRSDIGNPDAIDFDVWLIEGDLPDFAPDVGFYTYELDGTSPADGDTTPLVITSGPLVSNVTSNSALVSWSTNKASDSVVQYGKTSAYGLTARGADNVREHSVLLTSLSPDTTYYYRAGSTDSSGNTVWSIQRSFKTSAQGVIPSITASPSSVKPGQDISVSYSNAPGNNYDWIGMYRSGASNQEWLAWEYLGGKKSGTLTFKAPAAAGNYEFRMFENDKHDPSIATSNTVVVSSADSGGVTSGRVAYWPLDSNVNDAVGNHDGTAAGGATFVDDASRGMVFKVDGVSGHAVVPHASDISFSDSDSFTLSLWVKVLKLQNRWTAIVYKSREAGPWYGLWIDNGNRWAFGSSFGNNLLGSSVQTNVWHHVALVQQGKNSGNKRIIYLNGNVDAQSTAASSNGTGKLYMGGSPPNTWYDHLDGLIDDVAIYNRALSSEEIEAIASGAGGGTTQPPTGKKLTIPEVTAKPGESVTVPINVDDASGLAGADITVTYNSSILSFSEVKSTMLSSPYWMSPVANPDIPGSIILRMAGNAIPSGSGSIVDIIFTVSSSAAVGSEAPVSFESAEAFDASGQNIPISTQNGKVKITTPGIKGDVNGDGAVKSNDAILALRISAGLLTPTAQQLWAADMNDDGKVKSNDSILILRKSAGLTAPGSDLIAREGEVPVEPGRSTSVALGEAHGISGESITVPLRVGNPDILAAGDVSISYDSSVLRAVSVSSESDMLMAFNLAEPGLVHIAFANSGGLDDHAIATLEFEIITDDVSPLAFRDVELYGGDALPIDVRKIDGQFASWAIPPENSALLQNFPNPFNPETWIPYQLREDSEVTIRIYDATGGLVRGLELGHRSAGIYVSKDRAAYWDGRNEAGESVASGVYFYTIQAGKLAATRKMVIAQ